MAQTTNIAKATMTMPTISIQHNDPPSDDDEDGHDCPDLGFRR
jgi:hypothetical protein